MKGTYRHKRGSARGNGKGVQGPLVQCTSCGKSGPRRSILFPRQGEGGEPLCEACFREQAPHLVRVEDALDRLLCNPGRIRILWRRAHCEPAAFHVLEGDHPRRRRSGLPKREQASIRVRETEELLESDSALQVFIRPGVSEEEAAAVLAGIADRLRRGGYAMSVE